MRDYSIRLSNKQALTDIGTHASTDVYDLGAGGDALTKLPFVVVDVDTAFTSDGAGTLQVKLQTSDDEAFATADDLAISPEFAKAALTVGARLMAVRLPLGLKRYVRAAYVVGTAAFTAGKVTADFASSIDVRRPQA